MTLTKPRVNKCSFFSTTSKNFILYVNHELNKSVPQISDPTHLHPLAYVAVKQITTLHAVTCCGWEHNTYMFYTLNQSRSKPTKNKLYIFHRNNCKSKKDDTCYRGLLFQCVNTSMARCAPTPYLCVAVLWFYN
jgi:hypothetical protein